MQTETKLVAKLLKRDTFPVDDRSFLIDLRRSLLQMLTVIEKKLGIRRQCRKCGHALSE